MDGPPWPPRGDDRGLGARTRRHGGRGALAHSRWFVAAWIAAGVAMGAVLYQPAFAALTRWYGPRHVGALTILTLVAGLASTVFAPLTAALAGPSALAHHISRPRRSHWPWSPFPAHFFGLRQPWPPAAAPAPRGAPHPHHPKPAVRRAHRGDRAGHVRVLRDHRQPGAVDGRTRHQHPGRRGRPGPGWCRPGAGPAGISRPGAACWRPGPHRGHPGRHRGHHRTARCFHLTDRRWSPWRSSPVSRVAS